ncbi:MAG: glycosyltransferase 87 family protein, partial [Bacteroidota bacterium]
MGKHQALLTALAVGLGISTIGLGYFCQQAQFSHIISFFLLGFVCYLFLFLKSKPTDIKWLVGLGIALRFSLVFAFPALSDDIYRFIWDGQLWLNGLNPFEQLPTYYMQAPNEVAGLSPELFELLNSQKYFTVYPPIAQATFTIAVWLSPNSWWGASVVMKLLLLGCEIGAIFLLWRLITQFELPPANILLYVLNPLVIVEVVGNLHHEGMMVFFLLLAFYWLTQSKYHWSAVAMACSIASKLLPLMFLPFLIRRLGWKQSIRYFAILGATCLVLFLPLFSEVFIQNFSQSLDLYFRRFEFNGSVYYLLREWGYSWTGRNMIQMLGPILALLTLTGILVATFVEREASWKKLPLRWLFAISLYLSFT